MSVLTVSTLSLPPRPRSALLPAASSLTGVSRPNGAHAPGSPAVDPFISPAVNPLRPISPGGRILPCILPVESFMPPCFPPPSPTGFPPPLGGGCIPPMPLTSREPSPTCTRKQLNPEFCETNRSSLAAAVVRRPPCRVSRHPWAAAASHPCPPESPCPPRSSPQPRNLRNEPKAIISPLKTIAFAPSPASARHPRFTLNPPPALTCL
jgi:hypothetical protein